MSMNYEKVNQVLMKILEKKFGAKITPKVIRKAGE